MESNTEILDRLREEYRADPGKLDAATRLAQHYCDLGWLNEALDIYQAALRDNAQDYSLLLEYGNVCFRRGDHKEAASAFSKLTELKPGRIEGWNNLGIVQLALGDNESAGKSFKRVLEIEPQNPGALLNMGNSQFDRKEYKDALVYFEKAVDVRPDFPDAWFNLGNTYLALEKFADAHTAFERAVRYQREFPSALKNLGYACERLGDIARAEECYLKASELSKADATLQVNLANIYLGQKKIDEAKKCFLKAVRLAPKNTSGWLGLRHLALLKGDINTYMRATLAILPHLSDDLVAGSIEILCELNHVGKAEEILAQADRLNKTGDELDAQRLLIYQRRKQHPGRIATIHRRLLALPKVSDSVRKSLARYALATESYEASIQQIRRMKNPGTAGLAVLWRAQIGKGDISDAKAMISSHLQENPDCFDCWFLLARIEARQNNREAARANLIHALENGFTSMEELQEDPVLKEIFETLTSGSGSSNAGNLDTSNIL